MKLSTKQALLKAVPSLRAKTENLVSLLRGALTDNSATIPGSVIVYSIVVPNSATSTSITVPEKIRVINAHFKKTNATGVGSAKTITLKNGSNAITDAMDIAVVDKTLVRAGTLDDAYTEVAEGNTLVATVTTTGQNAQGVLYITAVRLD